MLGKVDQELDDQQQLEQNVYFCSLHYSQSGNIGVFLSRIIFARNYKKLVFLPQLSNIDTRQARKNLATKLK